MISKIIGFSQSDQSHYVCFANVHMLWEAHRKPKFQKILKEADLVCPDGKPVSLFMKYHYGQQQERICGMDLFPEVLREAANHDIKVFFYGSTCRVLDKISRKARQDFPGLQIVGAYSPPFRPLSKREDASVIDMINASDADLVCISLGCPKQERWMYEHLHQLNACMLGLGQAFLTYSGLEKRLPPWARKLSLEWLYRLYLEPGRLWKRYLYGNSWFLYRTLFSR
jgi:N-acetylglucosaminyldiphosphoundecaprenol N-acetyl-beta-D-mannosaminyltransferase